MVLNPQAEELNSVIQHSSEVVYNLLSRKGKAIYYPKKGILAQTADAKEKRINATIGAAVEDDGSPMRLKSVEKAISLNPLDVFPYAPSFGRDDLRAKWKELIAKKNPGLQGKTLSLPVVTHALTHALSMAAYLFIDEGDEIILPDLFWGNYTLLLANGYGAKLVTHNTFNENGFDVGAFREKVNEGEIGKKIIILNFPNNPTGYTPTVSEAQEIVSAIQEAAQRGNSMVVFIDDAYFGLVYESGIEQESLFSSLADVHENVLAVKIDGATKEDYVWGFRVGFMTFGIKRGSPDMYAALESKAAGAVRGSISNASNLSQSLLFSAYQSDSYESEKREKYELLKSRYEAAKKELAEHSEYAEYFTALPFNSGYFMCVRLQKGLDAEKVRQVLLQKYDTGVISLGTIIRVAFSAVAKGSISELYENMYLACKDISSNLKKAI